MQCRKTVAAATILLAELAWAQPGFDPWLADGINKQIQRNWEELEESLRKGTPAPPPGTAATSAAVVHNQWPYRLCRQLLQQRLA